MAKQLPGGYLEGTIDGINYYRRKGSYLARRKPGVSRQRWQLDGTFERTREAAADFGRGVRQAVGLRQALSWLLKGVCTLRSLGQLHGRMFRCVRTDLANAPDERELNFETLGDFLLGYEFNDRVELGGVFLGTWTTDWQAGAGVYRIWVDGFDSGVDLVAPTGATHFTLCSGVAWWTETGYRWSAVMVESEVRSVEVGSVEAMELVLEGVEVPEGSRAVAVLGVRWFVAEGATYRMLVGGARNALRVIEVGKPVVG